MKAFRDQGDTVTFVVEVTDLKSNCILILPEYARGQTRRRVGLAVPHVAEPAVGDALVGGDEQALARGEQRPQRLLQARPRGLRGRQVGAVAERVLGREALSYMTSTIKLARSLMVKQPVCTGRSVRPATIFCFCQFMALRT